jgi:hypothetical protein
MCAACVQQVEGAVSATALLASLALSTLVFVVGSQRVPQSHQQYVVPVGLLCTVALNRAVVAGSVLSALLLSVVQAPLLFLAVAAVVVLLRRGVVTRSVEGGVDDGADGATPPMFASVLVASPCERWAVCTRRRVGASYLLDLRNCECRSLRQGDFCRVAW